MNDLFWKKSSTFEDLIILDICKQTKLKYGLDLLKLKELNKIWRLNALCLWRCFLFGPIFPIYSLLLALFFQFPLLSLFSHFSYFDLVFPFFLFWPCFPYFFYFGVQCYIEWSVGTFCQLMDPEIGSCYITNTKLLLFYCTKKWEGLVIEGWYLLCRSKSKNVKILWLY